MKPQNILKEEWRYLIILDACRFDKFQKFAPAFFKGHLELRDAMAIWTLEWLVNTFSKYYGNIAYVSPVWFCNSIESVERRHWKFTASEHFVKIYDAWRYCWNEEKGAVLPRDLSRMARRAILKHPEWRFIIHYQQPHTPYLSLRNSIRLKNKPKNLSKLPLKKVLSRKATRTYQRLFGIESLWNLFQRFGMSPRTHMESAWRLVGKQGLIRLYELNLLTALRSSRRLIYHLPPGKVVITSDHGELLGERGWWGHGPPKPRLTSLIGVPWFVVDRHVKTVLDDRTRALRRSEINELAD